MRGYSYHALLDTRVTCRCVAVSLTSRQGCGTVNSRDDKGIFLSPHRNLIQMKPDSVAFIINDKSDNHTIHPERYGMPVSS